MGPRIDGFGIRIDLISPAKRNIASNCVRVISFLARSKSPIWGGSPQTNKVVRFPWFCARADFAKNTRISRSWKAVPSRRNAFSTFDGRSKVIQQIPRDRPRRRRHMGSSISSIFPHELKCENISFRFTVYFKPFTKTTVFTTSSGCCTSCWDSKSFKGWMGSALLGGCVCPTQRPKKMGTSRIRADKQRYEKYLMRTNLGRERVCVSRCVCNMCQSSQSISSAVFVSCNYTALVPRHFHNRIICEVFVFWMILVCKIDIFKTVFCNETS